MTDSNPRIEIFDPPMCCPTGVCGTDVDPQLSRFASDLEWLAQQGASVRRYSLTQEPQEFVSNPQVHALITKTDGSALPVITLDGRVVSQGVYPSRAELASILHSAHNIVATAPIMPGAAKPGEGCCGPKGCC